MKCFYHSADLDGHCSGALVKMAHPDCELIPINYGDGFPWDSVPAGGGERVYMVDFSLQPYPKMRKLDIHADPLIWIDHHISAIKDHKEWCEQGNGGILGLLRVGIGACQLVWEYLNPGGTVPTFIKLLAQYDVWDHSDPRTLGFQYGMRQYNTFPNDNMELWKELFDVERVQQIVNEGGLLLNYEQEQNKKFISSNGFKTELDGLKCIAANKIFTNSKLFDSVWDPKKYDAMLTFGWRKGGWTVSLYTDKQGVDVSEIAKSRGGGGHVQAAGFPCTELPFSLR